MARARNIKPKFFQNDELGELSPLARLLFIGLWTIADYKGCLEYRAKRIKTQLLPYDECSIEELASALDKSGFIAIYSVAGRMYIKILKFTEHQNPHKNERDSGSEIPDLSEKDCEISKLTQDGSTRDKNGTAPAVSLLLNPVSLNPLPDSGLPPPAEPPAEKIEPENPPRAFTAVDLSIAMRKCGVMTQPANPVLHALAEQGVSPDTVTAACEEAKRAKPGEQVGPGYVFKILERWAKDAAALKVAGATAPKSTGGAWWASETSIAAKGAEFGLTARGGERNEDFKARIQAFIDNDGKAPVVVARSRIEAPAPMEPRGIKPAGLDLKALIRQPPGGTA